VKARRFERATRGARDEVRHRIEAVVDSIPRGRVATYGQVAAVAGLPRRARRVGRVLRELPAGSKVPWHRVVGAGGVISLPLDGAGREQRRRLLREKVVVSATGRVDLARYAWGEGRGLGAISPDRP
jgi:methylated-DNA-protein-cysteine methyltransferase related protein